MNDLAYEIAKTLFPFPVFCDYWCDDGHGGIDEAAVEKRWQEKAALIRPMLLELAEHKAVETHFGLKGGVCIKPDEVCPALNAAMEIIQCVGTTGVYHVGRQANAWMKRYYPNWA